MSVTPTLALSIAALISLAVPTRTARADGAIGLAASWQNKADYGGQTRANFVPELVGFGYVGFEAPHWFLRPGARLALSGLVQADMPEHLAVHERDLIGQFELGVVYDAVVVPSLTFGLGAMWRRIELETGGAVRAAADNISHHEVLPVASGQLGVGVPLGGLLIEPFVRYEVVAGDDRLSWRYGVEATVAAF
jgi:hypothetical protein